MIRFIKTWLCLERMNKNPEGPVGAAFRTFDPQKRGSRVCIVRKSTTISPTKTFSILLSHLLMLFQSLAQLRSNLARQIPRILLVVPSMSDLHIVSTARSGMPGARRTLPRAGRASAWDAARRNRRGRAGRTFQQCGN